MSTLPPNANDFARMIERYNREMEQYLQRAAEVQEALAAEEPTESTEVAIVEEEIPVKEVSVVAEVATPEAEETIAAIEVVASTAEEEQTVTSPEALLEPIEEPPTTPPLVSQGGVGFLQVQASTAQGILPVVGASVTVSGNEDGTPVLYHATFTDESGLTPLLALPAAATALSQQPNLPAPYRVYTVLVQKAGYTSVMRENVPVYEGITARQPVFLVPLREGEAPGAPQVLDDGVPSL